MADESRLTLLTTCADSGEAGALKSRLEAEGIPCVAQGEHHSALMGPLYSAIIEVRMMVPEAALGRARELLASWESAGDEAGEGSEGVPGEAAEDGNPRCADHRSPSIGTCARCGAFVCEACVGGAAGDSTSELLCPSCDARASQEQTPRRKRTRTFAMVLLAFMVLPILLALLYGGFQAALGR